MSSDPFSFTPPKGLGAPLSQWRAVRRDDGSLIIERRVLQGRPWVEQTPERIIREIARGTEAGGWLGRLRAAGLLA